ncbi:MAG: diguanylate cyclase [Acidimicrobiales bacterium]|nr:diguanylate cyclase [Acidimicrobiales bacterium]
MPIWPIRSGNKGSPTSVVAATTFATATVAAGPTLDAFKDFLRDDLTGLGSLLALRAQLEQLIDGFQPFGARPALLLVDIDGFGPINSVYGRSIGDEVLAITAARLRQLISGENATYRSGGDEFAVLLAPMPMFEAVSWAEQLQAALSDTFEIDGSIVPMTVSVAVVMLGHRHRVDGLLRDADVTMYRAKAEGGNRVDVYNWEVDSWSTARKRDAARLEKEVEELRLQNRVLTEALTLDLTTGMPNALAFEADHLQLYAWRKRAGEAYAVLLVSVDGVNEFRARFRTRQGSEAIVGVGHTVRDTVRQSDRAYALDEGTFAVLLRGSTTKQAIGAAQRIRAKVDKLGLKHPADGGRPVTVTLAAIEAGYRHAEAQDVVTEVSSLLQSAIDKGGARIVWPH